ncbi:MAG: hypothetical protein QXG52_09175 [Candidatus Caldarchaeum sp.]
MVNETIEVEIQGEKYVMRLITLADLEEWDDIQARKRSEGLGEGRLAWLNYRFLLSRCLVNPRKDEDEISRMPIKILQQLMAKLLEASGFPAPTISTPTRLIS